MRGSFYHHNKSVLCDLAFIATVGHQCVSQHPPSFSRDSPASRTRHLHYQATNVQSLQHPAHCGTPTPAILVRKCITWDGRSDILVAEPLGDMITLQHRREQPGLLLTSRVEPR